MVQNYACVLKENKTCPQMDVLLLQIQTKTKAGPGMAEEYLKEVANTLFSSTRKLYYLCKNGNFKRKNRC